MHVFLYLIIQRNGVQRNFFYGRGGGGIWGAYLSDETRIVKVIFCFKKIVLSLKIFFL